MEDKLQIKFHDEWEACLYLAMLTSFFASITPLRLSSHYACLSTAFDLFKVQSNLFDIHGNRQLIGIAELE